MRHLVSQLKSIRRAAKLTQDQLAARLKLSRVQISRIEGGARGTSYEVIESWLDACGFDVALIDRGSPSGAGLAAELAQADDETRALALRLVRLVPRLDERSRRILENTIKIYETDADAPVGRNRVAEDE